MPTSAEAGQRTAAVAYFKKLGATRLVECWGDDVPKGVLTDFYKATQAKDDETPVFAWIEYPDKATRDAANKKMSEDPAARSFEEIVFSYPTIEAITAHRVAHLLFSEQVPMIPRIISEYAHSRTSVDIHPGARIGERFFLDHGTGVVIGETSEIGNNVKMYQGVTLGALSVRRSEFDGELLPKSHPTLQDNVTIYADATILGGATVIGKNSVIGGNVWIVKSVPPGSKIFGRPRE